MNLHILRGSPLLAGFRLWLLQSSLSLSAPAVPTPRLTSTPLPCLCPLRRCRRISEHSPQESASSGHHPSHFISGSADRGLCSETRFQREQPRKGKIKQYLSRGECSKHRFRARPTTAAMGHASSRHPWPAGRRRALISEASLPKPTALV